ncbi:MAG: FAD-dependent pyridine nucleotide-disulfide oxidoreductase [Pseudomonas sp.]|jgi:3-phenylpropionate/trans-cinnamate dioxygenase ferredoxin reductase subunit|uniref:NAD(P)/FAD-dependent oxidoreductase n=1 Tax=Pseudomonas sp. TaxID=306 RepID=UPI002637B2E4|nr:FAD-dependent oxidoreductase [Pseudomonas sp.]MDB6049169.1 FAD-dependent pyridine nucleotide-disulfide oxidoreductase [Pseudomonas sp.]
MRTLDQPTAVIIGAGHAGSEAAISLRQNGYTGRIVLVGDEQSLPYQRPSLSKAFLAGSVAAEAILLRPLAIYAKSEIEMRVGTRVTGIDRASHHITLSDGTSLRYTRLILATGSRPRLLQAPGLPVGKVSANVHYLRTLADVERLHPQFIGGQRLVIIGGGYIGLEVASVARKAGLEVVVLEASSRVLSRVTAPEVSSFYEAVHRSAGVDIRVNTQIERFTYDASTECVSGIVTCDGATLLLDLVIIGIGVLPNSELAEQAGLEVDNGIQVNEFAQTSDPDIFAIGDCSSHPSPIYSRRLRLESVPNALEQARTAAKAINGMLVPYAPVPWFWSDQYDLKLQMVGLSLGYDQVVMRGSPAKRSFVVFYLLSGSIIAADCINRSQEFMFAKKLVAARATPSPSMLADEMLNLKALLDALPAQLLEPVQPA